MEAIAVTHNSARDLRRLMASIPVRTAFERIIVIDNASIDDSVALAEQGGAEVLAHPTNVGFGAAVNAGAALVSGRTFAILNPDVVCETPTVVERAARHFLDPTVGVVAPALRLPSGQLQDSVRTVPSLGDLVARRFLPGQALRGAIFTNAVTDVPWAVAASWFVDKGWFERLGGFDERYFLYFEDVDYCVRLTEMGGVVRHDPSINFEHRHRADSRKTIVGWANRTHIRSAIRFFTEHPRYLFHSAAARYQAPSDELASDPVKKDRSASPPAT